MPDDEAILNRKAKAHNGGLLALLRFWRRILARFIAFGGLERAGSLAYTTLLCLVPLMTVVVAVLTAFPVGERMNEMVQDFIFSNFVPAAGEVIHRYLVAFSNKASHLSGVGFLVLLVVAVMLVASIDNAFNAIWEVERKRRPLNKFLVYWAVISLGPLLVGASLLATSYLVSLPLVSEATASGLGKRLLNWLPVAMSAMAFGLLYWLVPNRPVKGWHALAGGIFAAVLFEGAKQAFAWYITNFPTYEVVYGALAAIPIFLVWLYLSWIVVLLGAELTYGLGAHGHLLEGRGALGEFEQLLKLGLRLAQAQRRGEAVGGAELVHCCRDAERLLTRMQRAGLVDRNERGRWLLSRAAQGVTLHDLYRIAQERLPEPGEPAWPRDPRLAALLSPLGRCLAEGLDRPLSALLEAEATSPAEGDADR